MSDNQHPHDGNAEPIPLEGETWAPPAEDDNAVSASTHSGISNIFLGPDGLRAGWSIALYVLIASALVFASFFIASRLHVGPRRLDRSAGSVQTLPAFVIFSEGIVAGAVVLAAWIMSKIERRRFAAYGLDSFNPHRIAQFLKGLVSGIAVLSLLVGVLWKLHLLVFVGVDRTAPLHYGLLWLIAMLLVAVFEEFLFRGFIMFSFIRGFSHTNRGRDSFWIAAVISSIIFGGVHWGNAGESIIGVCAAASIGLVFCYSLWRTGSLWWAVAFHAGWNWAQSFFYGVGDSGLQSAGSFLRSHPQGNHLLSGGTVGPEGSIFVLFAVILAALIIRFTLRPEGWASNQE